MFRPSPERAVALYVQTGNDGASCRICGREFETSEAAAGHVKGLLAMQALQDHCRIHGFNATPESSARVPRLPTARNPLDPRQDDDDDGDDRRRSLFDLLPFRW